MSAPQALFLNFSARVFRLVNMIPSLFRVKFPIPRGGLLAFFFIAFIFVCQEMTENFVDREKTFLDIFLDTPNTIPGTSLLTIS